MTSENLFEKALSRGEVEDFFLGRGEYFSRDRESHEHDYSSFILGWVRKFIEKDPENNLNIFFDKLTKFLEKSYGNSDLYKPIISILYKVSVSIKREYYSLTNVRENLLAQFYQALKNYFESISLSNEAQKDVGLYSDAIRKNKCNSISDNIGY